MPARYRYERMALCLSVTSWFSINHKYQLVSQMDPRDALPQEHRAAEMDAQCDKLNVVSIVNLVRPLTVHFAVYRTKRPTSWS